VSVKAAVEAFIPARNAETMSASKADRDGPDTAAVWPDTTDSTAFV
jgi:hypothetical protein